MAQINTTISDEINELLTQMSEVTGISKSGLISEYVRRGLLEDAARQEVALRFQAQVRPRNLSKEKSK
jgi:hypothetical protein